MIAVIISRDDILPRFPRARCRMGRSALTLFSFAGARRHFAYCGYSVRYFSFSHIWLALTGQRRVTKRHQALSHFCRQRHGSSTNGPWLNVTASGTLHDMRARFYHARQLPAAACMKQAATLSATTRRRADTRCCRELRRLSLFRQLRRQSFTRTIR